MGNPVFRFRLTHTQSGQSYEISEPEGWIDSKLTLSRDMEYHSLIEKFDSAFLFYGSNGMEDGGVNFIRNIERSYGFDTDLVVDIDVAFDGVSYEDVFTGLYDFTLNEETNRNKIKSAIIRNDFWSKFISRADTPVDIDSATDLDGNAVTVFQPLIMGLTPQVLDMRSEAEQKRGFNTGIEYPADFSDPSFQVDIGTNQIAQLNLDDVIIDEITDNHNIPFGVIPSGERAAPLYTMEYGGVYEFDIKISLTLLAIETTIPQGTKYYNMSGSFAPGASDVDPIAQGNTGIAARVMIQFNDEDPVQLVRTDKTVTFSVIPTIASQTNNWSEFTYQGSKDLVLGSQVRLWVENLSNQWGYGNNTVTITIFQPWVLGTETNDVPLQPGYAATDPGPIIQGLTAYPFYVPFGNPPGSGSYINILGHTTFAETRVETSLIHDTAGKIIDRIIGGSNNFYSDVLGSQVTSYRQYEEDGCYWNHALIKGLQIRSYTLAEKPFFQSFNQWWNGANPIFNLGLSYDNVNGSEVIKVGFKEDFYDTTISARFDYVHDIVRRYDNEVIFNKVTVGNKRWEGEDLSGIDDPQTKHVYAPPLKKTGKEIILESEFMAASLAIENTRRQTKKKSSDYKLDNDTFIVSIRESESSPDNYVPELDENYSSITNLLNSSTRYNIGLTPARALLRWVNYLQIGLQFYVGNFFRFVSGQGNYDMTSDLISSDCGGYTEDLSEKQNITITTENLHRPEIFEIKLDMSWDQYRTIRESRTKAIGISQTAANHTVFFIKELSYEICRSKATIQAWPKTEFLITNIPFVKPVDTCYPIDIDTTCADSYETELGEDYLTEDGQCLELE